MNLLMRTQAKITHWGGLEIALQLIYTSAHICTHVKEYKRKFWGNISLCGSKLKCGPQDRGVAMHCWTLVGLKNWTYWDKIMPCVCSDAVLCEVRMPPHWTYIHWHIYSMSGRLHTTMALIGAKEVCSKNWSGIVSTTTADLLSGGVNELWLCVVAMGLGCSGTLPLQPPSVYSYLVTGWTFSVLYSSDHRHCTVWYFCQGIPQRRN